MNQSYREAKPFYYAEASISLSQDRMILIQYYITTVFICDFAITSSLIFVMTSTNVTPIISLRIETSEVN
jgi:hypothetical protein